MKERTEKEETHDAGTTKGHTLKKRRRAQETEASCHRLRGLVQLQGPLQESIKLWRHQEAHQLAEVLPDKADRGQESQHAGRRASCSCGCSCSHHGAPATSSNCGQSSCLELLQFLYYGCRLIHRLQRRVKAIKLPGQEIHLVFQCDICQEIHVVI